MSFSSKVQSFLKSLAGGDSQGEPEKKEEGKVDPNAEPKTNPETDPNADPDKKGQEGEAGDGTMEKGKFEDATYILNSLVSELEEVNKSLKTIVESQNDVGESIVGVAEMVNRIANSPLPPKSAMAKGGLGNAPAGGSAFPTAVQQNGVPTQDEFDRAQAILVKSYKDGEISLIKSEMISSDLQKAMRIPGYKMSPEYYNFLVSKMRTA
jgi:hypothetical protein